MRGHENIRIGAVAARQRARDKELRLLRFLRQNVFTSLKVLSLVVGIRTPSSVTPTLRRMADAGWVRPHVMPVLGGWTIPLWGITMAGQRWIAAHDNEEVVEFDFEPHRISPSLLGHDLDLHEVHAHGLRAGWTRWTNGNRLAVLPAGKRPDALAVSPSGHLTALEVERTYKDARRYAGILGCYLRAIKQGEVAQVIWLCPDEDFVHRLRTTLLGLNEVPVDGVYHPVEPQRHHRVLFFGTYDTWRAHARGLGLP